MAKGRLTQTEKYAIQGMLADGKSIAEIEEALDRSGGVAVKNYIAGDLDELLDTVVKARMQRVENGEPAEEVWDDIEDNYEDELEDEYEDDEVAEERSDRGNKVISSKELIKQKLESEKKPTIKVDDDIAKETLIKLKGVGLKPRKAQELFDRACKQLNRHPHNAQEMFNFCLRQLNVLDHMVTDTENPRTDEPEVAIMTGAASAAADERRAQRAKKQKDVVRSKRGGRGGDIYRPKTGEYV